MAELSTTVGEVFNPGVGDFSAACNKSGGVVQMRYTSSDEWLEVLQLPAGREILVTVTASGADYRIISATEGAAVYAFDGA